MALTALVEFAAGVVADITGRRAEQTGIGVFGGEFAHIETDVGAFVAENQGGEGAGQFGFADPGRTGEEQYPTRPTGGGGGLRPGQAGDRAHQNVHGFDDGRGLALDPLADFLRSAADAVAQIGFLPGVVERSDLEAAHGVTDLGQRQALFLGQAGDGEQVMQVQAFGELGEAVGELGPGGVGSGGMIGEGRGQQPGGVLALLEAGRRQAQAVQAVVVEGEPRRQVGFAVAQPEQRVVARRGVVGRGDGMGGVGELFATGEEFVFDFAELLDADRDARGVVQHRRRAEVGVNQRTEVGGGQAGEADRDRFGLEIGVESAAGDLAGGGGVGMDAHAVHPVVDQQELIAALRQRFPQGVEQG